MTYRGFLARLKKSGHEWTLKGEEGDQIRTRRRIVCDCPITAVCNEKFGVKFQNDEWEPAAKVLGLSKKTAARITHASDNLLDEKSRKELKKVSAVRRELLSVLGLKEKGESPVS